MKSIHKEKRGNEKIFEGLFEKYEQDIYKMAFIYMRNKDDALDVVQEAAYRAFIKFNTENEIRYFKTWLIKITINCAIDMLRKKQKVIHLQLEDNVLSSSINEDIPLSLSLQDLLELINVEEKTILLLKYYQGYTFQDISEIVDLPLSTVKSILYRALQKLRKQVRREDLYGQ